MKINGLSAISLSRQIAEVCEYLFGHRNNSSIHVTTTQKSTWNNKISNPSNEGSNGDVLVTDGDGGRSWATLIGTAQGKVPAIGSNWSSQSGDTRHFVFVDANGKVVTTTFTTDSYDDDMNDLADAINEKQDTLVSGTNIKTINNQSLLGSGNIVIQGGGGTITDVQINGSTIVSSGVANIPLANSSTNGVISKAFWSNLSGMYEDYNENGFQEPLVSGTNIKTINNQSLLGGGNIAIPYVPIFTINTSTGGTYTSEQLASCGLTADILDDMSSGLLTRCKIGSYIYEIVGVYGTRGVGMEFQLLYRNYQQDTGLYLYWNGSGYTAQVVSR